MQELGTEQVSSREFSGSCTIVYCIVTFDSTAKVKSVVQVDGFSL